ncbi:hypothetical protein NDU88_004427 [Pleurodeles waltl]|uniref:Uncharacterized protein n=1 Tax=Pleurodeles waltl TaxID=8319 RepID=A0AAV7W923_PLEWA|nr:hypothetical protein NDU88_004427 [Pleurodeles waltl]
MPPIALGWVRAGGRSPRYWLPRPSLVDLFIAGDAHYAASLPFQSSVPSLGPKARFRALTRIGDARLHLQVAVCTVCSPQAPLVLDCCGHQFRSPGSIGSRLLHSTVCAPLRRQPRPGPDRVDSGVHSGRAGSLERTGTMELQTRRNWN